MSMNSTRIDTPLAEAFQGSPNHSVTVLDGDRIVGILHMRDVLKVYAAEGTLAGKTAGDLMHAEVITVTESPNLLKPARLFEKHHVKSIVVVDEAGTPLRDLDPPELIQSLPQTLLGFFQPTQNVMVRNPACIRSDMPVSEALATIIERNFSCLPVCDGNESPLGILSESDLLRRIDELNDSATVADFMSAPAMTIQQSSNLRQVWDEMCADKVMKILVTDMSGRLCGLMTATDVLVALSKSLISMFEMHRCPEDADLGLEWRKDGMVMTASDRMVSALGVTREDLVGLPWGIGLKASMINELLELPRDGSLEITWSFGGREIPFTATRDVEHAAMWWKQA